MKMSMEVDTITKACRWIKKLFNQIYGFQPQYNILFILVLIGFNLPKNIANKCAINYLFFAILAEVAKVSKGKLRLQLC